MKKTKRKDFFDRIAEQMILMLDRHSPPERLDRLKSYYSAVYVGENIEKKCVEERSRVVADCLKIVLVILLVSLVAGLFSGKGNSLLRDGKLFRPEGAVSEVVSLFWNTESTDSQISGKLDVTVSGKKPDRETIEKALEKAESDIREEYPEGCVICGNLDFHSDISGTQISVAWTPENYTWVYADGSRNSRELPDEGVKLSITVTLSLYDVQRSFVVEPILSDKADTAQNFAKRLAKLLKKLESESGGEWIELPSELDGIKLTWTEKKDRALSLFPLLAIGCAVLLPLAEHSKRKKLLKQRERQMLNDYPELVSKLVLLTEAGMTLRGAVERIAGDYRKSTGKHYAYEELCITWREIENGVSEVSAFENFGKRCRLLPYLRLASMLEQNLLKGARSTIPLLEQEAANAFAERKEAAKKLGEEAGTKLLLPMAGMLAIVLVMILYPAFTNF